MPEVTIGLQNIIRPPAPNISCSENNIHFRGLAELPNGMLYDARAQVVFPGSSKDLCDAEGDTITIPASSKAQEFWAIISAGTDYDSSKGNTANNFTFRGDDPASSVLQAVKNAAPKSYADIRSAHIKDYQKLFQTFSLSLPDTKNSSLKQTADLINAYSSATGDPFVESLLFDYGRYLFMSSTRPGSLPPGLQGRWSQGSTASWGADFHANINLQMNFWSTEITGLAEQGEGLYKYMRETWVPRGTETAKLLYGVDGWVVHDEMNIFGESQTKFVQFFGG